MAQHSIRIKESGPVRVSLEVTRESEGSKFVQTVSLSAGDAGNRVEFGNAIDWKTLSANLKATFPLSASNENATYNWEIGTIERPNANERQFEVASHRWIDLSDKSGQLRNDHSDRLQKWIRQAKRQHAPPDAYAVSGNHASRQWPSVRI